MSKVKHIRDFTIGELLPIEQFDRNKHYVKVINKNKKHHNMTYREGLNINVSDSSKQTYVNDMICFTTLEFLPFFCDYGSLIAELMIPEDAKIVLDPEGNKYCANKIEILKFWDMNDFLEHVKYIEISCDADFRYLEIAEGLENLTNIKGDAYFNSLTSAKGLENLTNIGGSAFFNKLSKEELQHVEIEGFEGWQ